LKNDNLYKNFNTLKDNEDWNNSYKIYNENIDIFSVVIDRLVHKYNLTFIEARDSILYEIFSINYTRINRKRFFSFNKVKWFFIYIFTLLTVLMSGIVDFFLSLGQKKISRDILYEEMWSQKSWYSRFYKYIDRELDKNRYKISIFYIHPGVTKDFGTVSIENWDGDIINHRHKSLLFSFKKSFLLFKNDFLYAFNLYFLSKDINVTLLYLRILKKMVTYSSQVKGVKATILIGAGDYYWNPIKYIEYKKSIKNIILLQHNFKNEYLHNRLFQYCDYYYAHSQNAIDKLEGIDFSKKYSVGSFQLIPFLTEISNKNKYDILFLNQTVEDDLKNIYPNFNQNSLKESYYILIKNLKIYLEKYSDCRVLYIAKGETINSEPSLRVKRELEYLDNIEFIGAYGKDTFDLVNKSKLIINMYSSVGFEAYGLDKKVLWINYDHCCSEFKYDVEQEELHVIINDLSYEAFEKRVNLLLSDNKEVDEHYKKLKEKYMNIQGNPAKIVADKINEILKSKNENKNPRLHP